MDFIINNWVLIFEGIAIVVVVIGAVLGFLGLPTKTQIAKVKEWLVYACMEAEKELGEKTGQLKLRMVYDMFLTKFSWLSKVITFEQFSKMVDEALERFKKMLQENKNVKSYVEGE